MGCYKTEKVGVNPGPKNERLERGGYFSTTLHTRQDNKTPPLGGGAEKKKIKKTILKKPKGRGEHRGVGRPPPKK